MTKTKEEIIETHLTHDTYYRNGDSSKEENKMHEQDCRLCAVNYNNEIEDAMDEWAKQEAIAFMEAYQFGGIPFDKEPDNLNELYELYQQSKTK